MEYKIISAVSVEELTRLVNDEMVLGWQPQGGITVTRVAFYQALVRDDVLQKHGYIPMRVSEDVPEGEVHLKQDGKLVGKIVGLSQ